MPRFFILLFSYLLVCSCTTSRYGHLTSRTKTEHKIPEKIKQKADLDVPHSLKSVELNGIIRTDSWGPNAVKKIAPLPRLYILDYLPLLFDNSSAEMEVSDISPSALKHKIKTLTKNKSDTGNTGVILFIILALILLIVIIAPMIDDLLFPW